MNNLIYILLTELLMTPFIVFIVLYVATKYTELNTKKIAMMFILLAMMSGMLNSLNYYLLFPTGFLNQVTAINISMFEMSVFVSYILYAAFNGRISSMNRNHSKWIAITVGWNEVSMALFLYSLEFGFGSHGDAINTLNLIGAGITNYLFVIPMIIEMIALLLLRLHKGVSLRISISIILMQATDPGLFRGTLVIPITIVFSLVMVFVLYYVFSYIYKNRTSLESNWRSKVNYFIFLILISAVGLMASTFISGPFGVRWIVFAFSMAYSMVFYFLLSFNFFESPIVQKRYIHPDQQENENSF
jgi:hypothetical protein